MNIAQCFIAVLATAQLLHTVYCQKEPKITFVSQEQIQDLGSSAELACKVENGQDYPLVWIKSGKTPDDQITISSNEALITRDNRYSIRVDPSTSTFTLRINDIKQTDAGLYQCLLLLAVDNKLTAEVELKLRLPPVFSDNSTKSLVVSEGQSAKLECYADAYPKPEISWRRQDNVKLPDGNLIFYGNVLQIDKVQKEHRGVYFCVAENGVGGPGSKAHRIVSFEVEFAPVIETEQPRLGQALQNDMDLKCHVIAYPPPSVSWYKDEELLINNRHHAISLHSYTSDEYDSMLRVINIEKTHYGDYVCRASNQIGTAESKVQLFETDKPVCPPSCAETKNSTTPDQEKKATS